MFLLIDNYDSFTYNLYSLFLKEGEKVDVIKNDEFIPADKYEGIVISPGPSNPSNAGTSLKYLEHYMGSKPIFGVCLGMQCICHYLGYPVRRAASIKHGKLDTIKKERESILLSGITESFNAVRYHSLAVEADDIAIARSASDSEIMAVENSSKHLFGVQFHPESYLSSQGQKIINNFIEYSKSSKREVSYA